MNDRAAAWCLLTVFGARVDNSQLLEFPKRMIRTNRSNRTSEAQNQHKIFVLQMVTPQRNHTSTDRLGHSDTESTLRYLKPSRGQHVRDKVNEVFSSLYAARGVQQ